MLASKKSITVDMGTQMLLNVRDTGGCIFYRKYLYNRNIDCKILNYFWPWSKKWAGCDQPLNWYKYKLG